MFCTGYFIKWIEVFKGEVGSRDYEITPPEKWYPEKKEVQRLKKYNVNIEQYLVSARESIRLQNKRYTAARENNLLTYLKVAIEIENFGWIDVDKKSKFMYFVNIFFRPFNLFCIWIPGFILDRRNYLYHSSKNPAVV